MNLVTKPEIYGGPWCGGVTSNEAQIKASITGFVTRAHLQAADNARFENAVQVESVSMWSDPKGDYDKVVTGFHLMSLEPNRRYYYRILLNDLPVMPTGTFRTLPAEGTAARCRMAFGACSGNNSMFNLYYPQPETFLAIAHEPELLFFLHMGDLHYKDLKKAPVSKRVKAFDEQMKRPELREMFRAFPVTYMWDDHDFLGDDSGGGMPEFKDAARSAAQAFDIYVPHYPFAEPANGIYQSFVVGRVLFILTDNRSNRARKNTRSQTKTMLGEVQKVWLTEELLRGKNMDLIVWVNSLPWTGINPWADYWAGFSEERREISSFIADHNIRNLCMLAGNAHMLAIDDGTHTSYSKRNGKFPLFHAGALESRPTRKGGMYTIGRVDGGPGRGIAGSGQYGVMEVRYDEDMSNVLVFWEGKRVFKLFGKILTKTMLQYEFKVPVSAEAAIL